MVDEPDHVELGLFCTEVYRALSRVMSGKELDELGQSVHDGINLLALSRTSDVDSEPHSNAFSTPGPWQISMESSSSWDKRSRVSRRFHAKNNKETITAWRLDLDTIP